MEQDILCPECGRAMQNCTCAAPLDPAELQRQKERLRQTIIEYQDIATLRAEVARLTAERDRLVLHLEDMGYPEAEINAITRATPSPPPMRRGVILPSNRKEIT